MIFHRLNFHKNIFKKANVSSVSECIISHHAYISMLHFTIKTSLNDTFKYKFKRIFFPFYIKYMKNYENIKNQFFLHTNQASDTLVSTW